MREHIRLARSSPGPVEADWQTDAYGAQRRRRARSYNTQPKMGDDVMRESSNAHVVRRSLAETAPNLISDEWAQGQEKGTRDDAVDRVDRPDDRVIWSPSRLQRRRRSLTRWERASEPSTR